MRKYVYPGDSSSSPETSDNDEADGSARRFTWLDGIRDSVSKRRDLEKVVSPSADVRLKPGQIRLIYLKHHIRPMRRPSKSLINCSRYVFDLDNAPEFHTLSYTCAPAFRKQHIDGRECTLEEPIELLSETESRLRCDGRVIPIYSNLLHALNQLRHTLRRDMWLWVDCLSIRQDDLEELASQVQQMHRTYSSAKEVLVWLGPNLGLRHDVLGFIRDFCDVASKLLDPSTRQIQAQYKDTAILDTSWHSSLGIADFEEKLIDLMVFLKLCRYPSRLWCLQEIVLANKATILWYSRMENFHCITYLVDYFEKAGWFRWLDDALDEKNLYIPGEPWEALQGMRSIILRYFSDHRQTSFHRLGNRADMSISKNARLYFDFAELLHYSRNLACSDPRDKIYALLGLASRLNPPTLIDIGSVDYTIDVGDLYAYVQKRILDETQCLDLLSFVGHSLHASDQDLPSWGPDLRSTTTLETTMDVYLQTPSRISPAFLDVKPELQGLWFDGDKLCCRGVLLDEVEHNYRQPTGGRDRSYTDWIPSHQATFDALLALLRSQKGPSPFTTLTKTVLLDNHEQQPSASGSSSADMQLYFATYLILNHVYKGQPGDKSLASFLERCNQISSTLPHWGLDQALLSHVHALLADVRDAITTSETPDQVKEKFDRFQVKYDKAISRFVAASKLVANSRVLVRTAMGWLASTQNPVEKGDGIFVLAGSRTAYVLRKTAVEGEFIFGGDCYLWHDQTGLPERMAGLGEDVGLLKIV